jgi:RimJ/RimL family protein N-acetyltransferase
LLYIDQHLVQVLKTLASLTWHGIRGLLVLDYFELSARVEGLQTKRLALRACAAVDGWPLFEATRNPGFNRYLMWSKPSEASAGVARMEAISREHARGRMTAVSAVHRETGAWCGLFRLLPYAHDPFVVEMGLWVHPNFWGDDYGSELTQACIDAAFSLPEVNTLLAGTFPRNGGALGVVENCGLVYHSTVPREHEDGYVVELLEHRIDRARWQSLRLLRADLAKVSA